MHLSLTTERKFLLFSVFALALTTAERIYGNNPTVDRYGGTTLVRREATGFFRTEKMGGRWYFITPDGHPYIALGGNHIGSYLRTQAADGGLLARHADDPEQAAEALLKSLGELGLNAGDAYQPDDRFSRRLPWVESFHYLPGTNAKKFNVFDPEVVANVKAHVTGVCETIADNPWVIGVAGPDLPKWDLGYVHPYRIDKPGSTARTGYEGFLKTRHESIESLNSAYGRRFADWEDLAEKPRLNFEIKTVAAQADEDAFLALIADRHFAIVREAAKAGAPNHLYLGERTQLRVVPEQVLKAMGEHIDVFCTQSLIRLPQSPPEWQIFQREHYDSEFDLVGKPMVIIDWAAPFTLSENPVKTDYGILKPEEESGREAAQFVHDAFEPPYMVGLFICQVIGSHGNDKFFIGAKRTYLKDDGTRYRTRTALLREANLGVIEKLYQEIQER